MQLSFAGQDTIFTEAPSGNNENEIHDEEEERGNEDKQPGSDKGRPGLVVTVRP